MIDWGAKAASDDPDVRIGKGVAIIQQGSGLPGLDSANAAVAPARRRHLHAALAAAPTWARASTR